MVTKLIRSKSLWFALTLAVLFTLVGCSGNSPVAPEADNPASLNRIAAAAGLVDLPVVAAANTVTSPVQAATGGVIAISSEGYNHAFVVKAGGLSEDKIISVKVGRTVIGGKNAVEFEFGPDGLVFNEASKLEFDMAELNRRATSAKLYYYDPQASAWVLQGESAVVKGAAVFEIYHFSRYAISD